MNAVLLIADIRTNTNNLFNETNLFRCDYYEPANNAQILKICIIHHHLTIVTAINLSQIRTTIFTEILIKHSLNFFHLLINKSSLIIIHFPK